ncbi:hypothetical protein GCM10028867_13910 [Nocardioides pacificus]
MLGVEGLAGVLRGRGVDDVVPPDVHAVVPGDVLAGAAYDEHVADVEALGRGLGAGLVDGRLEGGGVAAPVAAVGGDDHLGLAVDQAGGERVGGEAAEDDRVGRADPGAGEHRDDRLGDHRQIDRDPVAGLDAQRGQRVGRAGDLALQVGIGERAGVVGGLADPVQRDAVAVAGLDVAVHAVVRRVEAPADEPLRERRVVPVEDPVPLPVPAEPLRLLCPEALAVGVGPVVGLGRDVGRRGQLGRRLEASLLVHQVGQGLVVVAHGLSRVSLGPAWRGSGLAGLGAGWGLVHSAGSAASLGALWCGSPPRPGGRSQALRRAGRRRR